MGKSLKKSRKLEKIGKLSGIDKLKDSHIKNLIRRTTLEVLRIYGGKSLAALRSEVIKKSNVEITLKSFREHMRKLTKKGRVVLISSKRRPSSSDKSKHCIRRYELGW